MKVRDGKFGALYRVSHFPEKHAMFKQNENELTRENFMC